MQKVSLFVEVVDPEHSALKLRSNMIENNKGLGPPDLCILTREHLPTGLKKLISKSQSKQYFHYVYGVDTSSVPLIAAYFKRLFDSYNKKVSGNPIISICFCTFDLFSKYDLRVEFELPGKTKAYMIDMTGNKLDPQEMNWKGAYLSSFLRSCYPISGTEISYVDQFKKTSDFDYIFQVANEFSDKVGFVLGDINDTIKYKRNLLIPALNQYLLKRKRYKLHQEILKKYVEQDPLLLTFLGKSSIELGKLDEILQLTSSQIKITPHAFPLYYTVARAHFKRGDTTQALAIAQYLIELNLEVYNYWELLIHCYIKLQDFHSALLAFNFLPNYLIEPEEFHLRDSASSTLPNDKISFAATACIWSTPRDLDFKVFEDYNFSKSRKEKIKIHDLDQLPGSKLSGSKLRAFKLLAKIEKLIEWNNLLKITEEVFRSDPVADKGLAVQKFSTAQGQLNMSGFTRSFFQPSQDFVHDPKIDNYIQPVSMVTCRDYFLQESKFNRLASMMSPARRIQNEVTVDLLNMMNLDLKTIYEWQKESSDIHAVHAVRAANNRKEQIIDIPYSGELWIRRGVLSERLLRYRLAERAYRYVVDKGFSIFAWHRLMKIYTKAGNPKAVLVCIVEMIQQMEIESVVFECLPPWIEVLLAKLCKGCGFKQISSLGEEVGIKKVPALIKALENLRYWKTDGVGMGECSN